MSNTYRLSNRLEIDEQSCKLRLVIIDPEIYEHQEDYVSLAISEELDAEQLEHVIIELVKVLSYFSDSPKDVLKRFNVTY